MLSQPVFKNFVKQMKDFIEEVFRIFSFSKTLLQQTFKGDSRVAGLKLGRPSAVIVLSHRVGGRIEGSNERQRTLGLLTGGMWGEGEGQDQGDIQLPGLSCWVAGGHLLREGRGSRFRGPHH